ncbi:hypothetical protein ACHAWF_014169 [Thalassiosira exigua]
MCISSHTNGQDELVDSLKRCRENDEYQMWKVISDGSYVMIQSYDDPDLCIAVDYEDKDDKEMLAKTCLNGEVMLKDCHSEYGTEWYFSGGQLVNAMCWGFGLSSALTVFVDDSNKQDELQECFKDVYVWGLNEEALLRADTFMFVNWLPNAPAYLDVDEVNDAIGRRFSKSKFLNARDAIDEDAIQANAADETILEFEGET